MKRILLCISMLIPLISIAQTGILEDFNDNNLDVGWEAVPETNFTLSEVNQELRVDATNAGSGWSNFEFNFTSQDISQNPVVQVKFKANTGFTCRIDVVDANGTSNSAAAFTQEVDASADYVNYVFNYDGRFGAANAETISKIVIFFEPGSNPGYTGTVYLEDLTIGDALPYVNFTSGPIRINQVGYELNGPKTAILEKDDANLSEVTFDILNENNQVVYTGDLVGNGMVTGWSGRYFWTADFSNFKTPGIYSLSIGSMKSNTFEIGENILFDQTVKDAISFFTGMRSTFESDRTLSFAGPRSETVNVYGGWWDATGDPGKHFSHLSYANYFNPQQIPFVVWSLLKSYELAGTSFGDFSDDLLNEAAWGADYMLRNLDPEGYFYLAIFDNWGNAPESREICEWGQDGDNAARTENYQCAFREGGGLAIAALARAYYMNLSGDSSSLQYLNGAIRAYTHLTSPGNGYATKSIEYANDHEENIIDDYAALFAASELYRATDDPAYKDDALARALKLINRMTEEGWLESDNNGQRPFYHAAEEGMPIVALLQYMDIDQSLNSEIRTFISNSLNWYQNISSEVTNPFTYLRQYQRSYSDGSLGTFKKAFFVPHDNETGYWWQGENARLASMSSAFLLASGYMNEPFEFGNNTISQYAISQLDWILGKNPFEICMMYGYGYKNYPHYPTFNGLQNIKGGICNGISADLDNPDDLTWKPYDDDSWQNWRWIEQWLPHNAWYVLAVSTLNHSINNPHLGTSEFGDLHLTINDNQVLIEWTTLSEVQGEYFEIQKSVDNGPFENIGIVSTQGGPGTYTEYSYTDTELTSNSAYRIVLIDINQDFISSPVKTLTVTGNNIQVLEDHIILYPNPFNGSTRIVLDGIDSERIVVKDLTGRELESYSSIKGKAVQVGQNLKTGTYLVEIYSNGDRITKKIVKTK